jgi:hypothetical protein
MSTEVREGDADVREDDTDVRGVAADRTPGPVDPMDPVRAAGRLCLDPLEGAVIAGALAFAPPGEPGIVTGLCLVRGDCNTRGLWGALGVDTLWGVRGAGMTAGVLGAGATTGVLVVRCTRCCCCGILGAAGAEGSARCGVRGAIWGGATCGWLTGGAMRGAVGTPVEPGIRGAGAPPRPSPPLPSAELAGAVTASAITETNAARPPQEIRWPLRTDACLRSIGCIPNRGAGELRRGVPAAEGFNAKFTMPVPPAIVRFVEISAACRRILGNAQHG